MWGSTVRPRGAWQRSEQLTSPVGLSQHIEWAEMFVLHHLAYFFCYYSIFLPLKWDLSERVAILRTVMTRRWDKLLPLTLQDRKSCLPHRQWFHSHKGYGPACEGQKTHEERLMKRWKEMALFINISKAIFCFGLWSLILISTFSFPSFMH